MQGEARHSGAELDEALPAIGSIFEGRFEIEQVLGRGGMGCVFLARHLELEQRVALKLLRPGHGDTERGALRLLREARASARIKSEHVVRVLDVVSRQKAAPYIVMEYLEGTDLAHHIAQHGPMTVSDTAGVVAQACEAVGEGHRLGIIHRDLKPSNLFLCERKAAGYFAKVLDFGISKTEDESAELLTHSHALLGSPVYTAPEQLQSSHGVDARADIWSLGVILYECVTGQRPFGGGSLAQVCTQILQEPPPPLERHRADLPATFRALVLRCLAKTPADRFGSVEDLLRALAEFAPQAAGKARSYLDGLAALPRGSSEPPPTVSVAGTNTFTGSTDYNTSVALARRSAQFRVGRLFWLVALLVSLAAIWAFRRVGARQNDGTKVSAAAPPNSPPLPVASPPSALPSLPAPAPSGSTARGFSPLPTEPSDAARDSAATLPAHKTAHKPLSPALPSSRPWVESR